MHLGDPWRPLAPLGVPLANIYLHNWKLEYLEELPWSQSMYWWRNVQFAKSRTLATTLHKPTGEENLYVQFGYVPLTIFNHNQGQISGLMNSDPMNMIKTSQQSIKEGLEEWVEGDFRSTNAINKSKQVWTTNRHPHHKLLQTRRGRESICPVWIRPTEKFQSHSRTSFRINENWYNQCKQVNNQEQKYYK